MIKVVMFDAGGVLHVSNTVVGDDLQQTFGLSKEQVLHLFNHYIPLMGTGAMTEQEMWDELRQEYGIRQVSADEKLLTRTFIDSLEKMPGMYELVDELKAKNIKVMLLTNVTPVYAEVLEQQGHYDPFDFKVLSYEVGSWKPDPVIYRHALEKAGVKPVEAVFIDDQEPNIAAAEAMGMHGIVFENTEQVRARLTELIPSLRN